MFNEIWTDIKENIKNTIISKLNNSFRFYNILRGDNGFNVKIQNSKKEIYWITSKNLNDNNVNYIKIGFYKPFPPIPDKPEDKLIRLMKIALTSQNYFITLTALEICIMKVTNDYSMLNHKINQIPIECFKFIKKQ